MNTMNSLKTLTLAAAAVLSIGVGGAMAAGPNYWSAQQRTTATQAAPQGPTVTTTRNGTVQYGTGDFDPFNQPARPDPSLGVAGGF
jgi:hypothetical protein